jgi:hemoglobin
MEEKKQTPFERIGGRNAIAKISKVFYDKVYAHEWIGQYFAHIKQDLLESQQTDFMSGSLNGPKKYSGRLPIPAHEYMVITDELFELREALLEESMSELKVPEDLKEIWHRIDRAFRSGIVKTAENPAKKRFPTDTILDFKKPYKKSVA